MPCLLFIFGCEDITHFQNYLIFLSWKYHPCETRLSIIQVKCSSNWPVSSPSLSIFSPNLVITALSGMEFTIFQSHLTLTIVPINCDATSVKGISLTWFSFLRVTFCPNLVITAWLDWEISVQLLYIIYVKTTNLTTSIFTTKEFLKSEYWFFLKP